MSVLPAQTDITAEEILAAAAEFKAATIDENTLFLEDVDGRKELLVFDGDKVRLTVYQDLTGLQEANKAAYNTPINQGCEFRRFARFPASFLEAYGFNNQLPSGWYYRKEYEGLLLRIAHDPQYRDFRTMPGNFIRRGA